MFTVGVTLCSVGYTVTKGGLVLNALLNDNDYTPMHATYNALVISAIVFSLLELATALVSFKFLRRLAVLRSEHRLIEDDEKQEEDGKTKSEPEKKKEADLSRLLTLAKPVSYLGPYSQKS